MGQHVVKRKRETKEDIRTRRRRQNRTLAIVLTVLVFSLNLGALAISGPYALWFYINLPVLLWFTWIQAGVWVLADKPAKPAELVSWPRTVRQRRELAEGLVEEEQARKVRQESIDFWVKVRDDEATPAAQRELAVQMLVEHFGLKPDARGDIVREKPERVDRELLREVYDRKSCPQCERADHTVHYGSDEWKRFKAALGSNKFAQAELDAETGTGMRPGDDDIRYREYERALNEQAERLMNEQSARERKQWDRALQRGAVQPRKIDLDDVQFYDYDEAMKGYESKRPRTPERYVRNRMRRMGVQPGLIKTRPMTDDEALRMLSDCSWGPSASLILPSGEKLTGNEITRRVEQAREGDDLG